MGRRLLPNRERKHTMKHRVLLIAFVVLISFSCGKKDNVVEVQFWNFGGTVNFMKWVRQRIETFNQTHPGIRVVQSDKSWNMIREILYANFSAGVGPDVMTVHANYAAEFGGAGFFYPLNKFPDFEEVKRKYEPNLFESGRYKDDYYGLPSAAIAFVLVCNKALFDREGIRPPKTWSEFREAAKRLTKDTNGDGTIDQYGLVVMGGDKGGFAYRLIPFFLKAGVNFMSDDMTKITFNTPRGVAALKLFADMYQTDHSITPGFLAYTLSEINDLFSGNRVAMSIEGPWFRAMVQEKSPGNDFYTVPVPVPDDMIAQYDTAPTLQDMVMYPISAQSKHLEETWEFLKYIRNEESDMAYVRANLGAIATTNFALNSPEAEQYPDMQVYRHELQHARPWPAHPAIIPIVNNVLAPYGQKAIAGEITPQEALDLAAKEAQEIVEGKK
jgi:multiple sugar transport system substrate-binding protein